MAKDKIQNVNGLQQKVQEGRSGYMGGKSVRLTSEFELTPGLPLFLGKSKQLWHVIEVDHNKATALLLMGEYLGPRAYHSRYEEVGWEQCNLRSWLNGEFLEDYFSATERDAIVESEHGSPDTIGQTSSDGDKTKDKVFLLSLDEINELSNLNLWSGKSGRSCWLRSTEYGEYAPVLGSGSAKLLWNGNQYWVRPAMRVDLNNAGLQKLIGTRKDHPFTLRIPDLMIRADNALDAFTAKLYFQKGGLKRWYPMGLHGKKLPKLRLKTGEEAPEALLRVLIMETCLCCQKEPVVFPCPDVEALEDSLSAVSMHEAVDDLCELLNEQNVHYLLPAICRYGSGRQINGLLSNTVSFLFDGGGFSYFYIYDSPKTRYADKHYGSNALDILTPCLCLSDTHEAAFWLEKSVGLKRYAETRQRSAEEFREWNLFDFGFGRDGKKIYDLGGLRVEVSLSSRFRLVLKDTKSEKRIHRLPDENTNLELKQKAKDDLDDLSDNLPRALKLLREELYELFLSGAATPVDAWVRRWEENGLCRALAEQLVWEQAGRRFVIGEDSLTDSAGDPYPLSDAPVRLAHPMETPPEEVQYWTSFFDKRGHCQSFPQMHEPVIARDEFRSDRYRGRRISCYRLRHQEKLGIHWNLELEAIIRGMYCWRVRFDVDDFSWEARWRSGETSGIGCYDGEDFAVGPNKWVEFTSLVPKVWNRRVNAVIVFLDRLAKSKYAGGCQLSQ